MDAAAAAADPGNGPPQAAAPPTATCYMCLEGGTDDNPLRRNCACRGSDAGFAHMDCLVRAAEANRNLWWECSVCNQDFFGDVQLGLARAHWERVQDRASIAPLRALLRLSFSLALLLLSTAPLRLLSLC